MHSRICLPVLILISLTSYAAKADTATQTDWSGGGGVPGPVVLWGDDFDSDSDVNWSSSQGEVFLGYESSEWTISDTYVSPKTIYAADVNGDGYIDALAGGDSYQIIWWENIDGSATNWSEHCIDSSYFGASVRTVDINDDGYMDVFAAGWVENSVVWWENEDGTGTSWTRHTIDGDCDHPFAVHSEDIDDDGDVDILGAINGDSDICWWENTDGIGTAWTEHMVDSLFETARSVYAADVNDDGYMDVLGAAFTGDEIAWWENCDGYGTVWLKHLVRSGYNGTESVFAEDVNNDGYMDIMGASMYQAEITWWANEDGTGTNWTEYIIGFPISSPTAVVGEDIDSDGDIDAVVSPFSSSDSISWWENIDGSGTSWVKHTLDCSFGYTHSVCTEDMDGNGRMDILGGGSEIAWWNASDFCSEGLLESSILSLPVPAAWQDIGWTSSNPTGTSVSFQIRSSNDQGDMGPWSGPVTAPGSISGILTDGDSLFQYRLLLSSSSVDITPSLEDVTVSWTIFNGVEARTALEVCDWELQGVSMNPVFGPAVVGFSLGADAEVHIALFDLSGRVVREVRENYQAGSNQVIFDDLPAAVYTIRIESGNFIDSRRFVMLD